MTENGRYTVKNRTHHPGPAPVDVLLVASTGGHLLELHELAGHFATARRHWVTFDKPYANVLLDGETVTFAHYPTVRNPRNFVRNMFLALGMVARMRPRAVVTTGSGVGVPFVYAARLLGKRAIFVESLARSEELSLSGRLVYWACTDLFVQWPELVQRYPRARYVGALL
jgi:UDP-N-acetylglucosamine:LPS N-acetylglucosamine transferase